MILILAAFAQRSCICYYLVWAHSEGHPHAEETFTRTLMNVVDLRRNSGEYQAGSPEYGVERVRQTSPVKGCWHRVGEGLAKG